MTTPVPGPPSSDDALIAGHRLTDYCQMTPALARDLLALRARWRDRYVISLLDGICSARVVRPVFSPVVILTAGTPAELATIIEADHGERSSAQLP